MPVHNLYTAFRGGAFALLLALASGTAAYAQQTEPAEKPTTTPVVESATQPAAETAPAAEATQPAAEAAPASEAQPAAEAEPTTPPAKETAAETGPKPVTTSDSAAQNGLNTTADHSKFKALQGPFANGSEVTQACLKCHNKAGHQFMKSLHWTWNYKHPKTGQKLGKRHLVNNFCTNARGNEGMCAVCHASYNWSEETADHHFDPTVENQKNIDCLVCHDSTGKYYKTLPTRGNPACAVMFEGLPKLDLVKIAQNVALPSRANCGTCHFNGGGGDGVKHGDLDSSLKHPSRSLDVHMDEKGLNFACTKCHRTKNHMVQGSRYEMLAKDTGGTGKPGIGRDVASCESCHGNSPHPNTKILGIKLNSHTKKVACQTCHIPALARGGVATIVDWDWRTAGKLDKKGEGFQINNYHQGDGKHRHTYRSIKGDFVYGETWTKEDTERLKKKRAQAKHAKKDGEHKEEHYKYPTEDRKL
ncbi:MAG: tetrathionate reductase family octaheme c-type cytochrome, partial [Alphaproteobacteria bacterium]